MGRPARAKKGRTSRYSKWNANESLVMGSLLILFLGYLMDTMGLQLLYTLKRIS
uniref:Uncharacterized protein n=1 Tax=Rhizophora mucronata TaxID=61149 RepID=A0A2P2IM12_RHIMU